MPIEVRIDVVPHGVEALRHPIRIVRITQVERLDDDPEGWRVYRVVGARTSRVRHKRSDGAEVLVGLALAADQGLSRPTQSYAPIQPDDGSIGPDSP